MASKLTIDTTPRKGCKVYMSDLSHPQTFILSLVNNALKHHGSSDCRGNWSEIALVGARRLPTVTTAQFFPLFALHFSRLRRTFKLSPDAYAEALSNTFQGGAVGDGKSPALFFYSPSAGVIAKTLNSKETALLGRILPSMVEYMTANAGESTLPRFLGAFKIRSSVGFTRTLLVMENVFPASATIGKKFDLKGSSLSRFVAPEELERGCSTLKDANFSVKGLDPTHRTVLLAAESNADSHRLSDGGGGSAGEGRRGKQQGGFIAALGCDVEWLKGHGLVDYSLLVGFASDDEEQSSSSSSSSSSSIGFDDNSGDDEGAETRPPRNIKGLLKKAARVVMTVHHIAKIAKIDLHPADSSTALMMRMASEVNTAAPLCRPSRFSKLRGHCTTTTSGGGGSGGGGGGEKQRTTTAFIGIIDILTKFGVAKTAEYRYKQAIEAVRHCTPHSQAMSCVPPVIYGTRMMRYISANMAEVVPPGGDVAGIGGGAEDTTGKHSTRGTKTPLQRVTVHEGSEIKDANGGPLKEETKVGSGECGQRRQQRQIHVLDAATF